MSGTNPDDPNLESELRQTAGREWADEAAEDERLTEKLRDRRTQLSELMRVWVHTGQKVRAEAGSQSFAGIVTVAGTDYAVISREEDEVALKSASATWASESGRRGGRTQLEAPMSFKAHLSQLESTHEVVTVLVDDGRQLAGTVETVATDHIILITGGKDVVVPLAVVTAVSRPKSW